MPERDGRTGRAPVLLVTVLLLVLGAFGLLVIALVTGHTGWAWGSVAASAVAGVLLVTDWIARPKGITADRPASPADASTVWPASSADRPIVEPPSLTDGPASVSGWPGAVQADPSTVPADWATGEPAEPPAAGDTGRAAESDTPQAPAVERVTASTRRTGAAESGLPDLGRDQPAEPG